MQLLELKGKKEAARLIKAIEEWKSPAAHMPNETPEAAAVIARTVRSLELELATGRTHCTCHLSPGCATISR
jgi:hypothetical protein